MCGAYSLGSMQTRLGPPVTCYPVPVFLPGALWGESAHPPARRPLIGLPIDWAYNSRRCLEKSKIATLAQREEWGVCVGGPKDGAP